ncbi:N-acetylneuraminate epimerase [Pirellula sp. SH-Sr6A]|uniref:galactose oxidase n=1 Tax=Pirellula sp. SH-Sr6A TaxID=1632865 RepID=UPI00078CC568|nr:galactose oxidase [Pirellula sp. SH-Sr6A]AMV33846.1 N-acetylneuraminate epimerase [Pirellula sp. SH-Sr6A]
MGASICSILQRIRSCRIDALGIALGVGLLFYGASQGQMDWQKLPPLPDPHGFAGAFVGLVDEELIVLGGANFPIAPPWEGGIKQWSRKRYRLTSPDSSWVQSDDFREEIGYGVSITTAEGMVCIGGSNAHKHRDAVFLLQRDRSSDRTNALEEIPLPSLPKPLANMCGVQSGGYLYVMGGSETPDATQSSSAFLRLRWERKTLEAFATTDGSTDWRWESLPAWPGAPRMLATAAAINDTVLLAGGVALSADAKGKPVRRYLQDAFIYSPQRGWEQILDMPTPLAASPSPAWVQQGVLRIFGGDTGSRASLAPSSDHPGFSGSEYVYDMEKRQWSVGGESPVAPVTTTTVWWRGKYIIPTGEVRPGVRTPSVWAVGKGSNPYKETPPDPGKF